MLSVAIFRIPLQPKLRPAAWMSLKDNAIDLLGPISTVVQLFWSRRALFNGNCILVFSDAHPRAGWRRAHMMSIRPHTRPAATASWLGCSRLALPESESRLVRLVTCNLVLVALVYNRLVVIFYYCISALEKTKKMKRENGIQKRTPNCWTPVKKRRPDGSRVTQALRVLHFFK